MIKAAVITPYYKETSKILAECHASVVGQVHECLHVIVSDGHPLAEIDQWNAHHVKLPSCHNDIGSTPRLIGAYHAIGLGYDIIAFLDADNWFSENHISRVVEIIQTKNPSFVSTSRYLCRPDKSIIGICPSTNPNSFIDTNCMVFTKASFHLLHHWVLMPSYGHIIGDRIVFQHIKNSKISHFHTSEPTVYYRCNKEGVYHNLGELVPVGVEKKPNYQKSFELWIQDGNPPLK
jgi:glycosyltransferase involved in cell wall biosynthesis